MSELSQAIGMRIDTLHVIKYPTGRYGYVGQVPVELAYVDGTTPEKIAAATFGARFGPKTRTFATQAEAEQFAASCGYHVTT